MTKIIVHEERALAATSLLSVKVPSAWWMKSGISVVAGRPTVNRTNLTSSSFDASNSVLESATVVGVVSSVLVVDHSELSPSFSFISRLLDIAVVEWSDKVPCLLAFVVWETKIDPSVTGPSAATLSVAVMSGITAANLVDGNSVDGTNAIFVRSVSRGVVSGKKFSTSGGKDESIVPFPFASRVVISPEFFPIGFRDVSEFAPLELEIEFHSGFPGETVSFNDSDPEDLLVVLKECSNCKGDFGGDMVAKTRISVAVANDDCSNGCGVVGRNSRSDSVDLLKADFGCNTGSSGE